MYSIQIKNGEKSFIYATNTDGTVFAGNADAVKAKLKELLETNAIGKLSVVKNVRVTADFTLEEVE